MLRGLVKLIRHMDGLTGPVDLSDMAQLLRGADVEREELVQACKFNEVTYARNLLSKSPWYELLIICWRAGQCSPIHNHEDSACGVRVVDGIATETLYRRVGLGAGAVERVDRRAYQKGDVCISARDDIHLIENLEPGRDLITLHLYSPPLSMNYFELASDMQS